MGVSWRWTVAGSTVVACGLLWISLVPKAALSISQPSAETLQGVYALFPLQPPVTRLFPIEVGGELVAEHFVTVRAPVDGVLRRVHEDGDGSVEQGSVLAVIDSVELQQKRLENDSKVKELSALLQLYSPNSNPELRKLRAVLEASRKKQQYAEQAFEQMAELFRRGLVAGNEYADARVQLEAGRLALAASEREYDESGSLSAASYLKINNQLQVARLEQEQLQQASQGLVLKAPFSGLLRRYAPGKGHDTGEWLPGDVIKAQEPLFYLESRRSMAKVSAAKEMLQHFAMGDSVSVASVDGADKVEGRVLRIVSLPYEEGTSLNAAAQIWIGFATDAFGPVKGRRVRVSKAVLQQGTAVPTEVLLGSGAEQFVYVKRCQDPGWLFTRRRVTSSATEAGVALITAGLLDGDCIARVQGGQP